MPKILTMILAGGEGTRLYPLTAHRAKPAVPFAGRYRIIDFVLSNFVNSGFLKIKVLTQFKSNSLNKHLNRYWSLAPTQGFFVETIPAQMRMGPWWYKGNADAVYQNIEIITDEGPDYVCVFGADHIYRMDTRQMLDFHIAKKAELTVAAIPVPISDCHKFGIIQADRDGRMVNFVEKPSEPMPMPDRPDMAFASMGNYIFSTEALIRELIRDSKDENSSHDFGRDIVTSMFERCPVYVYNFSANRVPGVTGNDNSYWKDVGDLDTYWQAHMDLVSVTPAFNLYNYDWPIRTGHKPMPPAKFVFADERGHRIGYATDSMVSEGCIISGGRINRSILGPGVRINSYAYVSDSVLNDNVDVGRRAKVRRAIIDKEARILPGARIGFDPEEDRRRFTVTPNGIVVIPKRAVVD